MGQQRKMAMKTEDLHATDNNLISLVESAIHQHHIYGRPQSFDHFHLKHSALIITQDRKKR